MPTEIITDKTLPVIARKMPLAAALLSSWEHSSAGVIAIGRMMVSDVARMEQARFELGIPSLAE